MRLKLFYILFLSTLVGCDQITMVGADDDAESSVNFPAQQEFTIEECGQYSVSFDAEVAWSLSSDVEWIEFVDFFGESYSTIDGEAGELAVNFTVTDLLQGFETSVGAIIITMDNQSSTLATVVRAGKEYSISFVDIDPSDTLEFSYSNVDYNFNCDIAFTASFDWILTSLPEWVSTDDLTTEGSANTPYTITLTTQYENYLDLVEMESTINILCSTNYNVGEQLTITTRGASGLMLLTYDSSSNPFCFDSAGVAQASDVISFIVEGSGEVIDSQLYIVDKDGAVASWARMQQTETVDTQHGSYLMQCYRQIEVDPSDSYDDRSATIYVVPSSLTLDFNSQEAQEYIAGYISQAGTAAATDDLELSFLADDPSPAATISRMESSHTAYQSLLDSYSISAESIYLLEIDGDISEQVSLPFTFNYATDRVESIYLTTSAQMWFTAIVSGSTLNLSATNLGAAEGYIVLWQDGAARIILYCAML